MLSPCLSLVNSALLVLRRSCATIQKVRNAKCHPLGPCRRYLPIFVGAFELLAACPVTCLRARIAYHSDARKTAQMCVKFNQRLLSLSHTPCGTTVVSPASPHPPHLCSSLRPPICRDSCLSCPLHARVTTSYRYNVQGTFVGQAPLSGRYLPSGLRRTQAGRRTGGQGDKHARRQARNRVGRQTAILVACK